MSNAHLNRCWVLKKPLRIWSYLERRVDVQPHFTEKVPVERVCTRLRANYRMLEKWCTYQWSVHCSNTCIAAVVIIVVDSIMAGGKQAINPLDHNKGLSSSRNIQEHSGQEGTVQGDMTPANLLPSKCKIIICTWLRQCVHPLSSPALIKVVFSPE